MSSKLIFPSVNLLSFSRTQTGGVAKFSSTFNQNIAKAMNWTDVPECMTGADLEGELAATTLTLNPTDKQLEKYAMDLEVTKVSKFQTVRLELEGKNGKGHRTELRFQANFSDIEGAGKLEQYILTAGKSKLTVSYTKQATQDELPGVESTEEQRQAVLEGSSVQ